jgi:hypothetical protein
MAVLRNGSNPPLPPWRRVRSDGADQPIRSNRPKLPPNPPPAPKRP